MPTSQTTHERGAYQAAFEGFVEQTGANGGSWLAPVREAAMARFTALGFPTTRDEEWKYTSVAPIARAAFRLPSARTGRAPGPSLIEGFTFAPEEGCRLVFVDGRFAQHLSMLPPLPRGARAASLAEAMVSDRDRLEPHLARYADYRDRAFAALNTAFMSDGGFVFVPRGVVVERPIHLLFVSTSRDGATMTHPRNLILAEDGSHATIVETYAGPGPGAYLTNGITEIVAGAGAVIDHIKVQRESEEAFHVATIQAHLARDAGFTSHVISLGGALVRNDVNAVLDGEGADCALNGLYVTAGRQHVDNHTVIDHVRPHGSSRELYKGVLDGRSRGVFDGKIIVRPDAQKTDARQVNRNLILSEEALVNTKPQLEIRADDVKCTHAATIGQIEPDALFYLRSRGLDEDSARKVLMHAFVSDVVGRVNVGALKIQLELLLRARLSRGPEGGPPGKEAP